MDKYDIITLVIACTALLISGLSYRNTRKRNSFDIQKAKEAEIEKKKANIYPIARTDDGTAIVITVENKGQSKALNFRYLISPDPSCNFQYTPEITELASGQHFFCKGIIMRGPKDQLAISFSWDDDYKDNNILKLTIPINLPL